MSKFLALSNNNAKNAKFRSHVLHIFFLFFNFFVRKNLFSALFFNEILFLLEMFVVLKKYDLFSFCNWWVIFWPFFSEHTIFAYIFCMKMYIFSTWLHIGNLIFLENISQSPWIWKKNRQSKKARVMIYFKSCFSAILYSQTHFMWFL